MKHLETVEVKKSELSRQWEELLRPVERAARGLKRMELHDVEVRLSEEHGRTFLVLSGTQDFSVQTEVLVDLEDLKPKGARNAPVKILQTVGELIED